MGVALSWETKFSAVSQKFSFVTTFCVQDWGHRLIIKRPFLSNAMVRFALRLAPWNAFYSVVYLSDRWKRHVQFLHWTSQTTDMFCWPCSIPLFFASRRVLYRALIIQSLLYGTYWRYLHRHDYNSTALRFEAFSKREPFTIFTFFSITLLPYRNPYLFRFWTNTNQHEVFFLPSPPCACRSHRAVSLFS
jgi:hypothetical protein